MSILLTGNGSLFKRWGHLIGRLYDVNALRGGTATTNVLSGASFPTNFATIETDYSQGTALYQAIEGIQQAMASFFQSSNSIFSDFQTRVKNTLLAMYSIDQGLSANLPLQQLTTTPLGTVLVELIRQMNSASASINQSTVSLGAQTALGSPTGNPIIVGSLLNPQGLTYQTPFAETLNFKVTADSFGTATAGNEPVAVTGQPAVQDVFSPNWPGGSGASISLNCVDGSKNNSAGNVLQNSDFLTATTANNPDNWTIQVGAAGTDVFQTTSGTYTTSGGALQFTGTGSALLDAVTQSFNTTPTTTVGAGGTSYKLLPSTVYTVNGWVKCSATPVAGVLELALIDGSAYPGTVIQNDQGANNLFTKSLTAVSTSYVNFNGVFVTPAKMPTTTPYRLRLRLSTAIDSGKSCYVGRLSMAPAKQLYKGGPWLSIHSGNTNVVDGPTPDAWTMAVSNTPGLFAIWLERLLGLRSLGAGVGGDALIIPYSGAPTIADSLIA